MLFTGQIPYHATLNNDVVYTFNRQKKREEKAAIKLALKQEINAKKKKKDVQQQLDSNGKDELSESGMVNLE